MNPRTVISDELAAPVSATDYGHHWEDRRVVPGSGRTAGSALGGALEIAVDEFVTSL